MRKLLLVLNLLFFVFLAQAQIEKPKKDVQFVPFPYISYSSTLGLNLGISGLLTFRMNHKDTISPRSTIGGGYIWTTNKSHYGIFFTQLYFDEDKWRIVGAAGKGKYNFQTFLEIPGYSEGQFFDYSSVTSMVSARLFRKVVKKNYLGVGYFYNKVVTTFDSLPVDSTINSNAFQILYLNDTRDNVYYPTHGGKGNINVTFYPQSWGNSKNFYILQANYNRYFSVRRGNDVVAARTIIKSGSSTLDFQRQVTLNGVDLRGYTNGKYRGSMMFDIQGEYRWNFRPKLGLVGFAGLGTIGGSNISAFNNKIYPSIGAGFRYLAVSSTKMRLGFDVARGKDEWAFYFRIGEAF